MAPSLGSITAARHIAPAAAAIAAVIQEQPLAIRRLAPAHQLQFLGGKQLRGRLRDGPQNVLERILATALPLPAITAIGSCQAAVSHGLDSGLGDSFNILARSSLPHS